jgi:hypothetical protein
LEPGQVKYHEAEHKAGHTEAELEEYGDTVLITWRDWATLRERIKELLDEHPTGVEPLAFEGGYRAALFKVMELMDNWCI